MTEPEAKSLAGDLKGLMPMLTIEQGRAVKEALMQRENIADCQNAIRAYACDYEQFSLATFIDRLPARPGENQPAWDRIEYERVRDEGLAIEREQAINRALCDQLSDADFARIAREHIALFDKDVRDLPCYSVLKTPAQLRKSHYLTSLVAAHARAHGLVKSRVLEEVL